jgi:hypothetical protein
MRTRATHPATPSTSRSPLTHRPGQRRGSSGKTKASADVSHDQIVRRAHQIYLARGDGEGDALSDWLTAERELKTGALMGALTQKQPEPDRYH